MIEQFQRAMCPALTDGRSNIANPDRRGSAFFRTRIQLPKICKENYVFFCNKYIYILIVNYFVRLEFRIRYKKKFYTHTDPIVIFVSQIPG